MHSGMRCRFKNNNCLHFVEKYVHNVTKYCNLLGYFFVMSWHLYVSVSNQSQDSSSIDIPFVTLLYQTSKREFIYAFPNVCVIFFDNTRLPLRQLIDGEYYPVGGFTRE